MWCGLSGCSVITSMRHCTTAALRMSECAFSRSTGACGHFGWKSWCSCAVLYMAGQPEGERPSWPHGSRMGATALHMGLDVLFAMTRLSHDMRDMGLAEVMSSGSTGYLPWSSFFACADNVLMRNHVVTNGERLCCCVTLNHLAMAPIAVGVTRM